MEPGGKAPVIVYNNTDLEAVIDCGRTFGYYNAGQDCTAACRIYAYSKSHHKLVADITSEVKTISYAGADNSKNEICSLISDGQCGRVASLFKRASEQNHIEICSGSKLGGT